MEDAVAGSPTTEASTSFQHTEITQGVECPPYSPAMEVSDLPELMVDDVIEQLESLFDDVANVTYNNYGKKA